MKTKIYQSLEEARCALLNLVNAWIEAKNKSSAYNTEIIRFQVSLEQAHPLEWLTLQDCSEKIFWENRTQKEQFAGIGIAFEISDGKEGYENILLSVNKLLENSPDSVRFFGGMRFDASVPTSPEWEKWKTAHLTLPLVELCIVDQSVTLACHIHTGANADSKLKQLQKMLESMRTEDITIPDSPLIQLERHDIPEYRQWCSLVEQGLEKINAGNIDKVVLARTAVFNLARDYDPTELLLQLRRQAPQAFHYCFQLDAHHAFLGITPELLYRRSGSQIESEAIAGTRPRGFTLEDDQRLAAELRESEKEQREHLMVLERMERLLQKYCKKTERLSYLEPLKLRHVQHLQSKMRGTLRSEISDSDLLPAFHPTPAVSGTPDPEARALIRKLEPFDRGWYAGPVGWISRKQAEFAVGIRSGLLCGRILRIYTGAGIVDGSVPDEEWREIEVKLQSWQYLLERT
ncbi:MAG: Isochorismate synthase MenF [Deltaproteobacteria bacterium]|nr:Isochorismate synthase MenF [Deltaproteobacteria bacterium]